MALTARTNKWGKQRRERILLFGGPKCGKSHSVLQLAQWYEMTKTPGVFYYMDTDCTLDSIDDDSQFAGLNNIIPYEVHDWEDCHAAGLEIFKLAGAGDWIVIDMAHRPHEWVEKWYLGFKYKTDDLTKKLVELKWSGQKGFGDNPLLEPGDYKPIAAAYNGFFLPLALTSRAHIICITEKNGIYKGPGADPEKIRTYEKVGGKPAGQKSLDYQLSTILHMERTSFGRYVTTCGDRGEREMLEQAPYEDLVRSYLMPVGKWTDE